MRLLTVGGTRLTVSGWFVALLALFSLAGLAGKALLVFGAVLVHELAHAAVARAAGLMVREVELLPFGGVARLEGLSSAPPLTELTVAAAGPTMSLAAAALAGVAALWWPTEREMLHFIMHVNIMLAGFNLLPGLPLDGGRIVRAVLSLQVGYVRATSLTAGLGQVCAVLLCLLLVWQYAVEHSFNITLAIGAVFLVWSARAERRYAALWGMRRLVRQKELFLAQGVMPVRQLAALDSTTAQEVLKLFVPQKFHLVMVVDKRCILQGVLTEAQILEQVVDYGLQAPLRRFL